MSADDYAEGFAVIPRELQRDPSVSWKAKLVYLALSSRANARGECWPSHALIAEECGISTDSVQRGLEELRKLKVVAWEKDESKGSPGRHPNRYTLGSHTAHSGMSYRSQRGHVPPTAVVTIQENDTKEVRSAAVAAEFDEWYQTYPKKVGKPAALTKYKAARKKASAETLLAGAQLMAKAFASDKTYCPNPATWLHQERWNDETQGPTTTAPARRVDPVPSYQEMPAPDIESLKW